MKRRSVLAAIAANALPMRWPAAPRNITLAARLAGDARLDRVLGMARALVGSGLTAGTAYPEMWIRYLNTCIELGLFVTPASHYRQALRRFSLFQGPTGDLPDGYGPAAGKIERTYRTSTEAPGPFGHKNSVEVDQESSLIQAVWRYVRMTRDRTLLSETIDGQTVLRRMERAFEWIMCERWSPRYGLVWAATKIDWVDVQPENDPGDQIDALTHPAIGIYDNAFVIVAINEYLTLVAGDRPATAVWLAIRDETIANVRQHLWRGPEKNFMPHLDLAKGSPFPPGFDEGAIYYHEGTALAMEAACFPARRSPACWPVCGATRRPPAPGRSASRPVPPILPGCSKIPSFARPTLTRTGLTETGSAGGSFVNWPSTALPPTPIRSSRRCSTASSGSVTSLNGGHWNNQPQGFRYYRGAAGVMASAILAVRKAAAA